MAKSNAIRAGRAFVELFADDTALVRGLRRAQQRLSAFGEGARAIGTRLLIGASAVGAAFGAATKVFISSGDALEKMATRTGLSVETLSELKFAAEQSGSDLEVLEKGVRTLQRTLFDAAGGSATAKKSLDALGLSADDLLAMSPEDQFKVIAEAISRVPDAATRAALAMTILGKAGTQLLPLMQDGARGIEALQAEARRLGLTISTETASDAARLGDAIDALKSVLRATVITIGGALAPSLEAIVARTTRIAAAVNAWIARNRELVVTIAKITVGVAIVGGGLVTLGVMASIAAVALGGIASAITMAGAALGTIAGALAAVLSPIGLVVAAVIAGGVAFFRFTAMGRAAIDFLADKFGELAGIVRGTIGGIRDAISAGELGLAAEVLWAGLKVVWLEGTKEIRDTFGGGLVVMRQALLSVAMGMQRVWAKSMEFLSSASSRAANWIAKRWVELQGLVDDSIDVEQRKRDLDSIGQSNLTEIARRAEDALNALDKEQARREQDIMNDAADRMDDRRKALIDAKKALDDAIADAGKKREEADAARGARPTLRNPFEDFEFDAAAAERRVSVSGTFSAAGAQGLAAGSSAVERTAKATEETARYVRRMAERAQAGGLTFT
ncbi:MAG: phage tail tape measure protein [Phycisphaerales bacterium]|nr:phage tail tape measure protein [Phycisphaerales bacterium]